MTESAELAADERLALSVGQVRDRCDHAGEFRASLSDLLWLLDPDRRLVELIVTVLLVVSDVIESRVADDLVEPRLRLDLLVAEQCLVRLDQRVLDDIFSPIPSDDRACVADQGGAVAAHELVEGRSYASAKKFQESLVRLHAERCSRERGGGCRGTWFHLLFRLAPLEAAPYLFLVSGTRKRPKSHGANRTGLSVAWRSGRYSIGLERAAGVPGLLRLTGP